MTICLEPPKESIAKVLEIVLFRHKINSQKPNLENEKRNKSHKKQQKI